MGLGFAKYEGLGNDFIVVDAASPDAVSPARAKALCDRHFGVGADGVILVLPSSSADARMLVLNADGSRPEMCGNGLRCVALHVALARDASKADLAIETDAGPLDCAVERDGATARVAALVGHGQTSEPFEASFEGTRHVFERVSMGNPHAITFDAAVSEAEIDRFAPSVSGSIVGGSNVEFARVVDPRRIDLVVWERGVGRTLACGTGAAATAVASAVKGRSPFGEPIRVELPGGPLELTVDEPTLSVRMRGPARRVFVGEAALE